MVAYQGQDVLGGSEVNFSHVLAQGKPVVLNFFAGACAPCQAEMPGFQKVADQFGNRVIFVGLDVGSFTGLGTHDDAERLLRQLGIRYPAAYAVDTTPLTQYVQGMPTTVVFDAKGKVSSRFTGTVIQAQLDRALQGVLSG
jgi:thiol-disulfide isomerase/thioredoxin